MNPAAQAEPQASAYAQASWRALGTYVDLVVAGPSKIADARATAQELLDAVDRACSRFRDDSDLVRANAYAGTWTRVSPLLVEAVEVAVAAAAHTDGLVDPTLGQSLVAVGYDRDLAEVQRRPGSGPADLPALPALSGAWRRIRTDPTGGVLVPEGVALDLGATGKAFAADLIAAAIAERVGVDCVLSVGGDVAVGTVPGSTGHAWQVALRELPDEGEAVLLTLPDGGLATSTTLHRRWQHGGRTMHHILDPWTGRPVEHTWRTASVLADTCVAANTSSTAAIILGEAAVDWLEARDVTARLVAADGTIVTMGDWPQERADVQTGDDPGKGAE